MADETRDSHGHHSARDGARGSRNSLRLGGEGLRIRQLVGLYLREQLAGWRIGISLPARAKVKTDVGTDLSLISGWICVFLFNNRGFSRL